MADTLLDIAMMHSDALIARARDGDSNAQGKLVQLWYKRIYNFCYKFFFDHDMATEVAQKTFISMFRNLPRLQEINRFRSWLYTIAVNNCREELRRGKARRAESLSDWSEGSGGVFDWEAAHRHENPDRALRHAELTDLLHECLLELNEDQRAVLIMKEYEGLKFREIAEVLNISENTVKSRMYYGLDGMRKILEKKKITKESIGYEL